MSIEGLGSPFTPGINGVLDISRTDEERRHRNTSGNNAALASRSEQDQRSAFDTSLDDLLAEGNNNATGNRTGAGKIASWRNPHPAQTPEATTDIRTADRFTRGQEEAPVTYNAAGRLSGMQAGSAGGTLASQPTVIPKSGTSGSDEKDAGKNSTGSKSQDSAAKLQGDLSAEEEKLVEQLRQRDQEVRTHEQAHQATGGEHAGGISYTYQRGPDNRQYAVGGSVPIDVSPVPDDPEATVAKAEKVRAAAMAPASPSGADQQVAAKAIQLASKARTEQTEKRLNPEEDESGLAGLAGKSDTNALSKKSDKPDLTGRSDESGLAGRSNKSELAGRADESELAPNSDTEGTASATRNAEKAAEAGLTSQHTVSPGSIQIDRADKADNTGKPNDISATSATAGSALAGATNPLHLTLPRPAESAQRDSRDQQTNGDSAQSGSGSLASPSAQATRAAFAAMQQLGQLAAGAANSTMQPTGTASSSHNIEAERRVMNKATAAYARVRGETGLALLNTGISMSV